MIFGTASPPYLDKTNANIVHAALDLDPSALAIDMGASVRSGVGAMVMAAESSVPTLVVTGDIRTGQPGSADERDGGDAAAAYLWADGPEVIAELVAQASVTAEFLDRWRLPGALASRVWEERFGEHAYVPLADAAFAAALKEAGLTPAEVDVLVAAGAARPRRAHLRRRRRGRKRLADTFGQTVGNTGDRPARAGARRRARPGRARAGRSSS